MNPDFRVGPWLVQPSLNAVSQNGTSVRLEPKVMEVLVCLSGRAGEPVTKEELLQTVWRDTFVSDDVLKRSVSELRRVFGDDAHESRVIETIPKRGYRFVAAVEPANGQALESIRPQTIKAELSRPQAARRKRNVGFIAVGIFVFVGGLLLAFNVAGIRDRLLGKSALPPIRSLAVLPLQNLSGDPSQDYFADGMTEELITELSRLSSLRVISRTSVMRYKNANRPLPDIARELGVEGIVAGSVLRSADRVRITAQLVYAPQDKNIWAQSYERDLHDVLTLQSTVASTIADAIRVQMTPSEKAQLRISRPVNLAAHEAYLQGQYHLQKTADALFKKNKGTLSQMESRKAEEYFRLAIQQDPDYAPPYVGFSETWGGGPLSPGDWAPQAKPMLLKALQIDESLADAHRGLAGVLRCEWDWKGAEREYLRAIQLEPSNVDVHLEYANLLSTTEGQVEEAMREYEVAQSLDPKNDHMADAFYGMRQFDRAAELYKSQSQMRPSDFGPHMQLANIYALTNRHAEAIAEWQKMGTVLEYKEMAEAMGRAYKAAGYPNALRVFTKNLEQSSSKAYIPPWFVASIYGYLGDKDQAFAWLEKAYKSRDGTDSLFDPMWDPLRPDPRFKDLLRRVGLPQPSSG